MRTRIGKVLFTGAAAALAIGFCASTALATSATTLTVKVTGGGTYTAKLHQARRLRTTASA